MTECNTKIIATVLVTVLCTMVFIGLPMMSMIEAKAEARYYKLMLEKKDD